jgi:hypothetical protein
VKDLFVYHAGTGTIIPLSDEVYLVNNEYLDADTMEAFEYGEKDIPVMDHKGYRLDNYNMTNLFYGSGE